MYYKLNKLKFQLKIQLSLLTLQFKSLKQTLSNLLLLYRIQQRINQP